MELTTGAILRRITETPLSTAAHKLATIILDGIAWKDGYNGLERGTAAFTLAHLAEKMGVSRQHLTSLLVELAASGLALVRWKPNGKFAPWLFRFGGSIETEAATDVVSASGDTSLSRDSKNKTIFAGRIEIDAGTNVYRTPWADLIKAAKASLACWNVDTQVIWERFLAFNRARGNAAVPAGFLLGFMRRWRTSPDAAAKPNVLAVPKRSSTPGELELQRLIGIRPVKAVASSGLTVAFDGDHLAEIFDAEWGKGQDLDIGEAVDPDHSVFRLHCDGEIMKPIDGFAQFRGDALDGFDGMDLVQLHGQAA